MEFMKIYKYHLRNIIVARLGGFFGGMKIIRMGKLVRMDEGETIFGIVRLSSHVLGL